MVRVGAAVSGMRPSWVSGMGSGGSGAIIAWVRGGRGEGGVRAAVVSLSDGVS
jgi:hypothetical protein